MSVADAGIDNSDDDVGCAMLEVPGGWGVDQLDVVGAFGVACMGVIGDHCQLDPVVRVGILDQAALYVGAGFIGDAFQRVELDKLPSLVASHDFCTEGGGAGSVKFLQAYSLFGFYQKPPRVPASRQESEGSPEKKETQKKFEERRRKLTGQKASGCFLGLFPLGKYLYGWGHRFVWQSQSTRKSCLWFYRRPLRLASRCIDR